MRLTKGNKVEVFSTKEVPSGSWYPAEIIHGNGRNYMVKYDLDIGSQDEEIFDRVPRKAIRPCPPEMQFLQDWASGDVVEVYHCLCWKMATVLRVMGRDRLSVRLLGSSHDLEVSNFVIRPRICWQDDEWKVIGQDSSNHEERQDVPSKLKWNRNSQYMGTVVNRGQEIHTKNSSQCLKRKFKHCQSQRAYTLQSRKIRVIEKDSKQNQFASLRQPPLPEKCVTKLSGMISFMSLDIVKMLRLRMLLILPLYFHGQSWRHLHVASKCLMMILGSATFLFV